MQLSFFDLENRYEQLSKLKDPLEELNRMIDWNLFADLLRETTTKPRKSAAGRKPFNWVMLFKMLVLQRMHNLSDDRLEYQVRDRLSFMRFLGLDLAGIVPDAKTMWAFREELKKNQLTDNTTGNIAVIVQDDADTSIASINQDNSHYANAEIQQVAAVNANATINQINGSDYSSAFIFQTGGTNLSALIEQNGAEDSNADIYQDGNDLTANIYQSNDYNDAFINQSNELNIATINQSGLGVSGNPNDALITQQGIGDIATINQTGGAGNLASIFQGN